MKINDCFCFTDYIDDIYETFLDCVKTPVLFREAADELRDITPPPMNTMLEKQSRDDAVAKSMERKAMGTVSVPPTTPGKLQNGY